ncbi:zinc finger protein 777-like [Mugil cephalus]|uniref:zinc finger protein 777-like n=1 Tax=Mugil cephalus TaxID=48193 RepID=UPI001FB5D569|nr:zinc finger protein 777-like [Mugil cephalus]
MSTLHTPMPSRIMESMRHRRENIVKGVSSSNLMNDRRICFSCDQIFATQKCLEEHVCTCASFICSCGTEFAEYKDMLEHSTKHEPGHQVLDHETIRKRRIERCREEEEKLKRLRQGDVVWKMPKLPNMTSVSLPVKSALQGTMQPGPISQVPGLLPNPIPSSTEMQNIFASVGAPTVDLWTLYQPVVLVQTVRMFSKKRPYTCGKCGQGFMTKASLVSHHSSHVTDKISGCIGCGLLLSSKKLVPRFHICNSPHNVTKLKLITAKPPGFKAPNEVSINRIARPQGLPLSSSLQWKSQKHSAAGKGSQVRPVTSTLQLKDQNLTTYNKHMFPLNASVYTPINSASAVLGKPTETSSASNEVTCRVCHISFETPQMLQRHKCIMAREFMAQHRRGGRQHCKLQRMTPVARPNLAQMNGQIKLGVPPSLGINKNRVMSLGLDRGQGVGPVRDKTGVDDDGDDDDCYIVENGPEKPAEVIYQVTSSVPIKT